MSAVFVPNLALINSILRAKKNTALNTTPAGKDIPVLICINCSRLLKDKNGTPLYSENDLSLCCNKSTGRSVDVRSLQFNLQSLKELDSNPRTNPSVAAITQFKVVPDIILQSLVAVKAGS